jgi:chemotaxis regulatin CheY-phosphate phosphatase CheZ
VAYQRHAEVVLARWREVERQLDGMLAGTPEAEALRDEAAALRNEYQTLVRAALDNDRPAPPPFPKASVR